MTRNKKKVKKHVCLSVVQKLKLIEKLEQGISITDVCKIYDVTRQTVWSINKSKNKLQRFVALFSTGNINSSKLHTSTIGNRATMKCGLHKNLDKALYMWYIHQRSSGINVQQLQLKSEFNALVTRMGLSIKSTDVWLVNFKKRHGIIVSLSDASFSEPLESEKKDSNEDKVIPEEPIKVENLPSSSSSPPTTSTHHNIFKLNASTIRNKKHWRNANLDKALYKWYSQQRTSGVNVQRCQLKSEFNALVTRMGLNIKGTKQWLYRFKKRHGIMFSLSEEPCSEPSESEKKNSNEDQLNLEASIKVETLPSPSFLPLTASTYHNISEQFIKVENLPSSPSSPPTTSTPTKNFGESVKVENFSSESCSSPADIYHNYVWSEYDIKSEGSPSPSDDKSSDDK